MSDTKQKKEKPAKIPAAFKKPIKKKTFEKKFVKYIEHPGDRNFFVSCFDEQEEEFVIRGGLGKDDGKKLKTLLKVIKKNRKGPLKLVPLIFAAAVIAGLVILFTIFANPLLSRALEMGLEEIFEARSEVRGFHLSLLRFHIAIDSVTVANRDSPMKNLFQMGRTEIRMKPEAVLQGKIYIEEIRADHLLFGTDRAVSGALPGRIPRAQRKKPPSNEPPLVDLRNFDAMALLNQEYDKLRTPRLYDEAIAAYNETLAKWQGQVEGVRAKAEELRATAQPMLNLNVNSIRDMQDVTRTIQEINTMISAVQSAGDDAAAMVRGIEDDIDNARQLEQSARTALTDDINHLKSYIDLDSGSALAALEPSIREVLSDTAEQYLDYGIRGLEVLEKLKAQAEAKPKTEKPKKEPKVAFKGRDVIFPLRSYPKFYLGILASDFTLDTWNWAFDLRDISSNPDLTDRPVSLTLGLDEEGGSLQRQVAFTGSADFRTNPAQRFSAAVNGGGFPVSLGNELSKAGINGFNGETAFSFNLSGRTDGGSSVGGDIRITRAMLVDPRGTVAEAVNTAIREADLVELGIQYLHSIDQGDEFKITTNLADLIARALRNIVESYAKQAMDEIERLLRQRIDRYIDGRFVSKDEADLLFRAARSDRDAIEQTKNALTNKRTEFEQRVRSAADQTIENAQQQTDQAIQDVLQGRPPSAPGGGGLRIPGL